MNSNLVIPSLPPEISSVFPEAGLDGMITQLPPQLGSLKPGDALLLQTLINNGTLKTDNASLQVSVAINQQEVPLNVKLSAPLPLDTADTHRLAARVVSVRPEALRLQITSVDDVKISTFLKNNAATPQSGRTAPALSADLSASLPQIRPLPLNLKPQLAETVRQLNIPDNMKQQIISVLPETEVRLSVQSIVPQQIPAARPESLLSQILRPLTQQPEALQNIKEAAVRISNGLSELNGRTFPAVVEPSGGSQTVLSSPLGKITTETPLNLSENAELILQVVEVRSRPVSPLDTLLENLSRLFEKLPQTGKGDVAGRLLNLQTTVPERLNNLLEAVAPLQNLRPELAVEVLNRLPAQNEQMLPRLHAFYKAASGGGVEAWLGRELTAELSAQGAEGKEVVGRLGEFISSSVREGVSWRQVTLPFFDGQNLTQIKIALKKNRDEEEQEKTRRPRHAGTRFLVETDFSRLGKFQFDGFSIAAERRFDLIIRTTRPADDDLCAHIMNLFKTSLYNVGYAGNLKFGIQESFVKIIEDDAVQLKDGVYI